MILDTATDDTQRMMQMSGFGMDPSKVHVCITKTYSTSVSN